MAEGPTSIQQETADLRLSELKKRNVRVSWKATMHQRIFLVRTGIESNRRLQISYATNGVRSISLVSTYMVRN